ncbi:LOG family protein [Dinghuibacter silviterrae]|uniref:Cytokinin riboside 5'-monophosphate phosphoribohydrolase n=1 Tax=Dinghuibacter silviterrae TaxID=1539049 RepID=A0A4R8DEU5_9BACT|nr:TIGR00730 family Rossman fold protein [Dinghuibacter silviterrae]TDW95965.1 hypothetical protein EDB95_3786 [Dinghuibacter silviterrae]
MKRLAVFCGSSAGTDPVYLHQARLLGETLAGKKIGVVYGGASVGLMGAVADGALAAGGSVTGVIPAFLKTREIEHRGLTTLEVVENMHQRKQRIAELSDGAIALPGGFGTLEELFEVLTWGQLGLHQKPIGLLNTGGFYDDLLRWLDKAVSAGFLKKQNRETILVSEVVGGLLEKMMV